MRDQHQETTERMAKISALVYVPISVGSAAVFYAAAALLGEYPLVARIGGTVWVALLSLIVTMPLVISAVKKQGKD